MPTHAYALAVLSMSLLVHFGRQSGRLRWRNLARLGLAGGGIALVVLCLYLPVGAATGWGPLLHNPYVRSLRGAEFWGGLGKYLLEAATQLWGQGRLALAGLVALAVLVPGLWRWASPAQRAAGGLSYALLFGPGLLLLAQRVYVPGRALLPGVLFSFGLAGGVGAAMARWGLARVPAGWARRGRRAYPMVLAGLLLAYGAHRF